MDLIGKRDTLDIEIVKLQPASEDSKTGCFDNFRISAETKSRLINTGINYLFPIQAKTYPVIFEGKDLIGKDRTGSGKTLAFSLPILERMRSERSTLNNTAGQSPLVIVLVPTRELCMQVAREFTRFMNHEKEYRVLAVYGGTDINSQIGSLRNGTEILIGTPGRVIDLMDRKAFSFRSLRNFILDETDQMLNIGFQEDIERVLKTLRGELETNGKSMSTIQFLLFSATIPSWIDQIAGKFMKRDVVLVDMVTDSETRTSKTVEHLSMFFPSADHKIDSIGDCIMVYGGAHSRTIVFTDTKAEANDVMSRGKLKLECQVLHGDIPQKQRELTFAAFRKGTLKCLIATNVAARGLDIPEVDLIVQLSPPKDMDTYIHRSGRTGRAGKIGTCVTFFTRQQESVLEKIEFVAKIRFKKVGVPQPSDITKSTVRDVSYSFDNVSEEIAGLFEENVKTILAKYTPKQAIGRALAVISGYTNSLQQRSLLFSVEGFVTFKMELREEVESAEYFWNLLKKHFARNIIENVKGIRFLKNRKGVVFDLKETEKKQFENVAADLRIDGLVIEVAKTLPEIEEKSQANSAQGNNNSWGSEQDKSNNRQSGGGWTGVTRDKSNGNHGSSWQNGVSNASNDNNRDSWNQRPENNQSRQTERHFSNQGNIRSFGRPMDSSVGNGDGSLPPGKDDCKLFVGNFSVDFEENDVREMCEKKGVIYQDIYLVRNQDKSSKGFGYVKFSEAKLAREAMVQLGNLKIDGKTIRVNYTDKR